MGVWEKCSAEVRRSDMRRPESSDMKLELMAGNELRAQTPTPVLSGSCWVVVEALTGHGWLRHGYLNRTWKAGDRKAK